MQKQLEQYFGCIRFQQHWSLIVNDDFGVYRNELQIALNDHEDERKNKVGRIKDDELFLKVCKETRSFKDVMNCLFFCPYDTRIRTYVL